MNLVRLVTRGLRLYALAVLAMLAALWVCVSVLLIPLGIGLALLPQAILKLRFVARHARRANGLPEQSYEKEPRFEDGLFGLVERARWLITSPETKRDLIWGLTDPLVGGLLALLPGALLLYGVEGVLMPAIWLIFSPYGFHD